MRMMRRESRIAARGLFVSFAVAAAMLAGATARADNIQFTDFNVVTFGNVHTGHDIEGNVFVGGNLSGTNQMPIKSQAAASTYTVNVVGNVSAGSDLKVEHGSLLYGGSISGATINFNGGGHSTHDLSTLASQLTTLTKQMNDATKGYAAMTATSTVDGSGNNFTFNAKAGTDGVAVFNVSSSIFTTQNAGYALNVGAGVTSIVINVSGSGAINEASSIHFNNWLNSTLASTGKIIWNFSSDITAINLTTNFVGAILATGATVGSSTAIDGSVYAAALDTNGEVHLPYYSGYVPSSLHPDGAVPEPGSVVMGSLGVLSISVLAAWRRSRRRSA